MKLRGWILGLALCLMASPGWARHLATQNIGTILSGATNVSQTFKVGSLNAPVVVLVGYVSNSTQIVNVSVECTIDGANFAAPGQDQLTPNTAYTKAITGVGSYILFPFVLTADSGGTGTTDVIANPCDQFRIRTVNTGATAITNYRITILGGN